MKISNLISKKYVLPGLLFVLIFGVTVYFNIPKNKVAKIAASNFDNLKSYNAEDIALFDGTNDSQPIYIAMNGLVYDVSAGREFYKTDGPYHYLAGRDSSTELNMVGGGIIKRKYPVIGRYVDNVQK